MKKAVGWQLGGGKPERERSSLSFDAFDADFPSLRVDQCFGNGKTQACTSISALVQFDGVAAPRGIHPVEALEDKGKVGCRNACPAIGDGAFQSMICWLDA